MPVHRERLVAIHSAEVYCKLQGIAGPYLEDAVDAAGDVVKGCHECIMSLRLDFTEGLCSFSQGVLGIF